MFSPLTRTLLKIFAAGFYRAHSGLFLALLIGFASYGFYIQVLNQTHLSPDQIVPNNLLFVLTLISSPVMMILVAIFCIIFSVKSHQFVLSQLKRTENQFLFYSATSIKRSEQFKSWSIAQLIITLPLFFYATFCILVGTIYGDVLLPFLLFVFLTALTIANASVYVKHSNSSAENVYASWVARLTKQWRKPYWSLFIYHCFDKLALSLAITKAISLSLIISAIYLLPGVDHDVRLVILFNLGIVISHSILIYSSFHFENKYLTFVKNFPYSKFRVTSYWIVSFAVIMLPELTWMLLTFSFYSGVTLLIFNIVTTLLLRALLFENSTMKSFLTRLFIIFTSSFILVLFNAVWLFNVLSIITAVLIISTQYLKSHTTS